MKKLNMKGFTLIELLAVIVILAIVAAVTMTIVVPMMTDKPKEAAVTSVKEVNKAIANSCTSAGVSDMYGVFGATNYYTDNTKGTATTIDDCKTASCYVELSAQDLKNMNLSGDMPSVANVVVEKCRVVTSCLHYTTGSFANIKVKTNADGTVTATDDSTTCTTDVG